MTTLHHAKEKFKISKRSICSGCYNIDESCTFVHKICKNHKDDEFMHVSECAKFNKDFKAKNEIGEYIIVKNKTDSRVEMMGGGH